MFADAAFTLKDVITLAGLAFALGALWNGHKQTEREVERVDERHKKAITALETRIAQLEERFLTAIEELSDRLSEVGAELKDLLAQYNVRITLLENKEKLREE